MQPAKKILLYTTFLSLLTPIFFEIGTLLLTPSRILFLFATPILLCWITLGNKDKILLADVFVLAYVGWMTLAVFIHNPQVAITFTGSNVVMILGGYLIGRYCVRSPSEFTFFSKLLGITICALLPFAIYESWTPNNRTAPNMLIPAFLESLGLQSEKDVLYEPRVGLDRAQVVFPHPIHFGLYCSLGFSMVLLGLQNSIGTIQRFVWAGVIGFACFLSVSSGPFLAMLVQIALICYHLVTYRIPNRWPILGAVMLIGFCVLEVFTRRPAILVLVTAMSFSAHTVSVRWTLLDYGMSQVWKNPILGIGYYQSFGLPSWMSGSIDNMWLLAALIYGIPSFVFLLLSFVMPIWQVSRRKIEMENDIYCIRNAWIFTMISIILTMATVAVWNQIYSTIFLCLGAGVWMVTTDVDPLTDDEQDLLDDCECE